MVVSKLNFLWKPKWPDNMSGHPRICSDNARFWPDIVRWPAVISSPVHTSNTLNLVFRNLEFLSKKFSLQRAFMFLIALFNHIITLVYYFWIKPTTEFVKKQMDETTGNGMATLNGIFKATVSYLYFSN